MMYVKPKRALFSKEELLRSSKAGACVFFYTGCATNYSGCVYGYD